MNWDQIITTVSPYIVKIETPSGSGTGFLFAFNEDKSLCGIATALHVVSEADNWQQPIKIHNHDFSKTAFLRESQRFISSEWKTDSAVILFERGQLAFPEVLIPLRPLEPALRIGVEVGWLGYPAIASFTLCFFAGAISAPLSNAGYFIDGVAINGVSGGPVVHLDGETVQFVGLVSAYRANRATGETLPGLLVAQDVSHFHKVINDLKTLDEAKKKREAEEAMKKAEEGKNAPVVTASESPGCDSILAIWHNRRGAVVRVSEHRVLAQAPLCVNDTNGDGDCHLCHRQGACLWPRAQ